MNKMKFCVLLIALFLATCGKKEIEFQTTFPKSGGGGGGLIAVIGKEGRENQDIFLIIIDGGEPRQLTNTPDINEQGLVWSPKGDRLLFIDDLGSIKNSFYLINLDGSDFRPLADNFFWVGSYIWSPDGSRIAFAGLTEEDEAKKPYAVEQDKKLYVLDIEENQIQTVTDNYFWGGSHVWSPDGTKLAFTAIIESGEVTELFIFDIEEDQIRQLTNLETNISYPSWSSDGENLVFVSTELGIDYIYKIDEQGNNLQDPVYISDHQSNPRRYKPVWSPDRQQVVFKTPGDSSNLDKLSIVGFDGKDVKELGEFYGLKGASFLWSPDGKQIAFQVDPDPYNNHVYVIDSDGNNVWKFKIPETFISSFTWQP